MWIIYRLWGFLLLKPALGVLQIPAQSVATQRSLLSAPNPSLHRSRTLYDRKKKNRKAGRRRLDVYHRSVSAPTKRCTLRGTDSHVLRAETQVRGARQSYYIFKMTRKKRPTIEKAEMGVQTLTNLTRETECFTINLIYFTSIRVRARRQHLEWGGPFEKAIGHVFFFCFSVKVKTAQSDFFQV